MLRRSFIVALIALTVSACRKEERAAPVLSQPGLDRDGGPKPVPVETVALERGPVEAVLRFSTNLEAERQIMVLARTAGQIRSIQAEEGDAVKLNQILLRMDGEASASDLARAKHDVENAKRDFLKREQLFRKGIISAQEYEQASYELERLRLIAKDASRSAGYTVVRSPIDGTISERFVKFGDLVTPNQKLFQVTDFNSIVARVYVPEGSMGRLSTELQTRVYYAGFDEVVIGKIERIAPIVDPKSGTIKVTVALPNQSALRPGMFVDVEVVTDHKDNALRIPKRALVYDNDEPYVFVVVDGRASRRRVEVAIDDGDYVEPKSGFSEGESLVIAGQVGLKDNALVAPQAAPTPAITNDGGIL